MTDVRSDQQLIVDYLRGDEDSFKILVKRYLKPIYNFVYQYTNDSQEAQDITQEAFIKVWRYLKKFDQKKNFKTWIFQIAKNVSIDFFRKSRSVYGGKKIIPFSDFENEKEENVLIETMADPGPLPDELFEKADVSRVLASAMKKLPLKYQSTLFFYYYDHFTFQEIADILTEPLNTVKSRHRRALIMLRKILNDR